MKRLIYILFLVLLALRKATTPVWWMRRQERRCLL